MIICQNGMSRAWSTHGTKRNTYRVLVGNQEGNGRTFARRPESWKSKIRSWLPWESNQVWLCWRGLAAINPTDCPEGTKLGRCRRESEQHIKMNLRKIEWSGMDCTRLAQDRDQWRALMNTLMNLWIPQNIWNFLSSWVAGGFSRRIQLQGVSYITSSLRLRGHRLKVLEYSLQLLKDWVRIGNMLNPHWTVNYTPFTVFQPPGRWNRIIGMLLMVGTRYEWRMCVLLERLWNYGLEL
jgi:hypothetical protein